MNFSRNVRQAREPTRRLSGVITDFTAALTIGGLLVASYTISRNTGHGLIMRMLGKKFPSALYQDSRRTALEKPRIRTLRT
jgi:hypothetical protein